MYKMFQHLTGGVGLGAGQAVTPPLSEQQRSLSEQEVLALQLQEQAARQQAQALAQQQQPPLQVPLQVQQQVPLSGVDQMKNKRFIRLCDLMILLFSRQLL